MAKECNLPLNPKTVVFLHLTSSFRTNVEFRWGEPLHWCPHPPAACVNDAAFQRGCSHSAQGMSTSFCISETCPQPSELLTHLKFLQVKVYLNEKTLKKKNCKVKIIKTALKGYVITELAPK